MEVAALDGQIAVPELEILDITRAVRAAVLDRQLSAQEGFASIHIADHQITPAGIYLVPVQVEGIRPAGDEDTAVSARDICQQRDGIALMRRSEGAVDGIIIADVAGAADPRRHAGPEGRAALGTLAVRVDVVRIRHHRRVRGLRNVRLRRPRGGGQQRQAQGQHHKCT